MLEIPMPNPRHRARRDRAHGVSHTPPAGAAGPNPRHRARRDRAHGVSHTPPTEPIANNITGRDDTEVAET